MKQILIFLFCQILSLAAISQSSGNEYDMRAFRYNGASDTNKKHWSIKKLPANGPAVYTQGNEKWVGQFKNGHLDGSFIVFDADENLLLEGEAHLDTILQATQYRMLKWGKRVVLSAGAIEETQYTNKPVFTGQWKNGTWMSGRHYLYDLDEYVGPILKGYTEAWFDEKGKPSRQISNYLRLENSEEVYLFSYQETPDAVITRFRKNGSVLSTESIDPKFNEKVFRLFWEPGNAEKIVYEEARGKSYIYTYKDGSHNYAVQGWLTVQYTDGHCSKRLYDLYNKEVPGVTWTLPATGHGERSDTLNFREIPWKGGTYKGSVVNDRPNGWGRFYKSPRRFTEGFFKDGQMMGYALELSYLYDSDGYFSILKDGVPSSDHETTDVAAIAKQNQAELNRLYAQMEESARPKPLPGPKRIIDWNTELGWVKWSDFTYSYGTPIPLHELKRDMVMMHNGHLKVVADPPAIGMRTILFYGGQYSGNSYTVPANVPTVIVFPEISSATESLTAPCVVCGGTGTSLTPAKDEHGDYLYQYGGLKYQGGEIYSTYYQEVHSGTCTACMGRGRIATVK